MPCRHCTVINGKNSEETGVHTWNPQSCFFSFFGCAQPPLLISPSHHLLIFSPPSPNPTSRHLVSTLSSDGNEQLAPTTHDEYSADKEAHASDDVDVSR